jgi:hypothetical protein
VDEKQRIFNDLMRLYLYLGEQNKSYFLICGNQVGFTADFQNLLLKPAYFDETPYIKPEFKTSPSVKTGQKGFYAEWFSFDIDNPLLTNKFNSGNQEYKNIYEQFVNDYSEPYRRKTNRKLELPNSMTTNLIFLSPELKQPDALYQPFKIGIWEVAETI